MSIGLIGRKLGMLSLAVPTEEESDRAFNALAEGGEVRMPLGKTFWSPRFGMGDERVTTKKVRVVRTDAEKNLLLLRGSLPGGRGSLILVRKA